jgi:hypothetical protein
MASGWVRPNDDGQRWGSIALGAAAVVVAGWMTVESLDPAPIKKEADAGVVPPPLASSSATAKTDPVLALDASAPINLDAGLSMPSLSFDASVPTGAPRAVKLGIVVVTWAGAEGASSNARPKAQAKEVAEGLVSVARADFHQAVSKGDSGSADDMGRFPRGILDPNVEAVVFALGQNDVSEVVETPRGFWIVKRLD